PDDDAEADPAVRPHDGGCPPLSHRSEIDREAADVPAVRVADDQREARARRQVLGREPVGAARHVGSGLRASRGALVLHEGGCDLLTAREESRRVEAREVLARTAKLRQDHQPVLLALEQLLRLVRFQGLVLERGLARRNDDAMKRGEDGDAVTRRVGHPPLGVERLLGDRARAHPDRVAPLLGAQRERHRERPRRPHDEETEEARSRAEPHLISPTVTRLKESGGKYLAATSWMSLAVTRPIRSLYRSA